jgi:hypothetical protein
MMPDGGAFDAFQFHIAKPDRPFSIFAITYCLW